MADNIALNSMSGGSVVAADDISNVFYQVVKLGLGADGALDNLVDAGQQVMAASIPVVLASDSSDVKITLDSEAVVLGTGSAAIGKLAANSGVDIGDVTLNAGTAEFGKLAAGVAEIGNVKNSGTFVTQVNGDALTSLQLIDDVVHVDDAGFTLGTSKGVMTMGFAGTQSVNANDAAALACTTGGFLKVIAQTNSGVDIGDVDVTTITGVTMSNAGMQITGDEAHDAPDAGNPVKIGGKAVNFDGTAPVTPVAENDRTNALTDAHGALLIRGDQPYRWQATDNQSSAQTNTALQGAPGASLSLYITDMIISNGAVAGNVKIVEDTGGSPADIIEVMYFAINGGMSKRFATPIKITANKNVGYTSVTSTTHSVTLSGFIAP